VKIYTRVSDAVAQELDRRVETDGSTRAAALRHFLVQGLARHRDDGQEKGEYLQ
jgi:hypothetical protein